MCVCGVLNIIIIRLNTWGRSSQVVLPVLIFDDDDDDGNLNNLFFFSYEYKVELHY